MRLIDANALKETLNEIFETVEVVTFDDINATIDNAPTIEPKKGKWIPINSIEDIPKDRMLFVTLDNGYVETLYYDMTEWSDNEYARHAVAYMDYWKYEPMPYSGDV